MIAIDDICAIHAIGNYTQVLLAGGATEVVMRSLVRWEATLGGGRFIRVRRSNDRGRGADPAAGGVGERGGGLAEMEGSERGAGRESALSGSAAGGAGNRSSAGDDSFVQNSWHGERSDVRSCGIAPMDGPDFQNMTRREIEDYLIERSLVDASFRDG